MASMSINPLVLTPSTSFRCHRLLPRYVISEQRPMEEPGLLRSVAPGYKEHSVDSRMFPTMTSMSKMVSSITLS